MAAATPMGAPTLTAMYLNAWFAGQKSWKAYWFEVKNEFLEISVEQGKEAFTAVHLGVLKVRPSKDHPDRPDVLEFFDGEGFTDTKFHVFTYDPFDILDFFKAVAAAHTAWRQPAVEPPRAPQGCDVDVKGSGFFAGTTTWHVDGDRITVTGRKLYMLTDVVKLTPQMQPQHPAYFQMKTHAEAAEYRCVTGVTGLKTLLATVYTNKYLQSGPADRGSARPPAPVAAAAPPAAPGEAPGAGGGN